MSAEAGATSVLGPSGDYHLNLTSESAGQFEGVLDEFLRQTEADSVALIEHSGAVLSYKAGPAAAGSQQPDTQTIGVLAAGLFGSTQMMAQQLGETGAPEVFCHGAGKHFFCCPVNDNFALMTIFGPNVAVGIIRLNAQRAVETISNSLQQVVRSRTGYGQVTPAVPAASPAPAPAEAAEGPFMRYN